jgi:hypothetical protein
MLKSIRETRMLRGAKTDLDAAKPKISNRAAVWAGAPAGGPASERPESARKAMTRKYKRS